jgi:hypothetical protein
LDEKKSVPGVEEVEACRPVDEEVEEVLGDRLVLVPSIEEINRDVVILKPPMAKETLREEAPWLPKERGDRDKVTITKTA